MTATRLHAPGMAIDALMIETPKNRWLPNGHTYQRPNLPLYLPSNGGLLAAVALIVSTPKDWPAGWQVEAEGFKSFL